MRRRTTLGDRNLVGENIIRIRAEKKMSQGELLSQIQLMGIDMNQAKLSRIEGKHIAIDYTSEENEKWILYTVCDFSSIDDIYDIIENDEKGLKTVSADGKELFVSDNMDSQSAIWFNDKTEYILSGNIGKECIIQIAESVNYERK